MKRIIKWLFITVGILILSVVIIGTAFINISPQFGGSANKDQQLSYAETGHYQDGIFINDEEIIMEYNCHSITAMLKETMNPDPNVAPHQNIDVLKMDPQSIGTLPDSLPRITWLGHSSFLIEIDGKKGLIDPVFGQYAAPHPWLGRARFNKEMPITIDDLSNIDFVIISHDHYDHLDYESIDELKEKVNHFYVPLGVGNHLRRWEISDDKISEMDWWQEAKYKDLKIVLTPSRHMSGRGLSDQSATLWGSWVIQSQNTNIYFSGDGGYGKHFKEIGEKYGPFDVGLMECGQYNELWRDVHMMPEESVTAAQDIQAKLIVPIHWGSFALATHSWTDPVERIVKAAKKENMPIATPKIGQSILIDGELKTDYTHWWESKRYAMMR
ncbi:MBL fold metallo-hydrolase [Flammeovirga agarivorans]|uniref:MBL fold metallo-hydrolase n=1 Tax=Flammeovirga agarivorans TaxID=2726742 RepID=A0A7X8SJT2_9BACT|nr:MBL fold metallo-hydrolase [Flammeovirga agarivorans]NLR91437.1 MBL fold metallo-hydrolase [Flammeovirga agarivorans]